MNNINIDSSIRRKWQKLLLISVTFNLFFLLLGLGFIQKKGGIDFLVKKIFTVAMC